MRRGTTQDVRSLYEQHPYPSPVVGDSLADDLANMLRLLGPGADLAGKEVLDAGCGSGHRLLGLARKHPKGSFTGVDLSPASLEVAKQLAKKHGIENTRFEAANLQELDLGRSFDWIVSTGVVHHLESPKLGVAQLCRHLNADGVLFLWLYHALGEAERLLDRELLLTLLGPGKPNFKEGRQALEALGLHLDPEQYGPSNPETQDASQQSIDVDAYLHPIVHAFRFEEALDLFQSCDTAWQAVNGITIVNPASKRATGKLLDLDEVERSLFCLLSTGLFESTDLQERFLQLSHRERLRLIELRLRPTGLSLLAGKGNSLDRFGARIRANVLPP
jgi:SAM-dependent methyltransferase